MEFSTRLVMNSDVRRWTLCLVASASLGLPASMTLAQQRAPRAIPVEEPPPSNPVRAVPVDESGAPVPQAPVPARAQPVADPNRPAGPDEDLFDYATLAFSQGDFKIALKPYADYVRLYPNGRHAAEARFRLAECLRKTNLRKEAIAAYNDVMLNHPKSESASSAAYRLGMYAYEGREFQTASSWFEITERQSTNPEVRTAASFNKGLSLKYAGQPEKALAAFKIVAASKNPNMQKEIEISLQELAALAVAAGRKEEAAAAYKQILASSKDDKTQGETLVRYGLLLNEMKQPEEALKQFEKALASKDFPGELKATAVFGTLQANYVSGNLDGAIKTYTEHSTLLLPDELRPKQLLIVGTAYKKKQMYRQAVEVFLLIEKDHPESPEALDAGYQKLLCFFQLNDKDLPLFTERFEERYGAKYPKHEYLQMARLIRSDWYFSKQDYPKAAEAFVGVDVKRAPKEVRSSVIYKKGFAEAESGKSNDAINTLNLFISDYPNDPNLPVALAQRGVAYKAVGSNDRALADFGAILKQHPNSPAVEMALFQSARIKMQTRDIKGMIADYEALVQKFPNSGAAAEAYYFIGRGYFDLKEKNLYEKALEPLRKAISANREEYLDKASQTLIAIQAAREDLDGLAKEVDSYLEARKDASVSPNTLLLLGVRYFERGNYAASARYLGMASTPDEPKNTDAAVWNYLGKAELNNSKYEDAVKYFDFYLAQTPEGGGWAEALLYKAAALKELGHFDQAMQHVGEALQKVKEGRLNARLQMLRGGIADAIGDAYDKDGDKAKAAANWKESAGNYIVISQFFVDPEITPEAASKAARVLEKLGEIDKANALREQLKAKYPEYKLKEKEVAR
jgi:tetratricopeptide (TPR) repeat protein